MIDPRDIFYTVIGLALLCLTFQPALARHRLVNAPLLFVMVGMGLAIFGAPVLDPRGGGLTSRIIEHASELIVIISLAGAGLAIDTRFSWRSWQPTIRLLAIAMPLTILGVAVLGTQLAGLSLAGAVLLAAALAPTDPVLARSVQVGPPGQDETPEQVALTAEAGLNDGLAFPFVYLAIALAGLQSVEMGPWFWEWASWDLAYRVTVAAVVGTLIGHGLSRLTYSRIGDARQGGWNSIVLVLAATMLSYGLTEAVDGYGFLAVFAAARAGRAHGLSRKEETDYERLAHHGADQLESILLVLLLIWFGSFAAGGGLAGWRWQEIAIAVLLIFVLRPVAGWIALLGYACPDTSRWRIAVFGIRGMGSVFYVAYAQNHAEFGDIEAIWRITAITILLSIVVHGFASNFVLPAPEEPEETPHRD